MTAPEFDLEAVYDRQIAPLMSQIIAICQEHGLPMLASFCYRQQAGGIDLCTTSIPRDGWQPRSMVAATNLIYREEE